MSNQLKSRDELPWLYYPRSNSVRVINSFLSGGGGGSLAVNGKSPVAAWVPSLDTAGNGTTTLTDLIGSNDGTLTNMNAATDWVADTDAGGVRALSFSSNKYVNVPDSPDLDLTSQVSVSMWIKGSSTVGKVVMEKGVNLALLLQPNGDNQFYYLNNRLANVTGVSLAIFTGTWSHIVVTNTAANSQLWVNGILKHSTTASNATANSSPLTIGGRPSVASSVNALIDDIRIFDTGLDSTDIAYLNNSMSGRARTS